MDIEAFCRQSRVVIVVGKGGVGKTTVSAALAKMAAQQGLDVLLCALDDSGEIGRFFGSPIEIGSEESVVDATEPGKIRAQLISAKVALEEYLAEHGLRSIARRIIDAGGLDVVATATPGIRQLLLLGKVKQLERASTADLVVLDAPATGHAMTLLTSPVGLAQAARAGPLRAQAEEVVEFLRNGARCQVLLVTIPEETPVNEVVETAYRLEDEISIALGPVIINATMPVLSHLDVDPEDAAHEAGVGGIDGADLHRLTRAAHFRIERQNEQTKQKERLSRELPLAQLELPYLFSTGIGESELSSLADNLRQAVGQL